MRVGAVLPVPATLGVPPTPGNGFETRAAEDLRLLAELGLTDVRIGLDWGRVQPAPGQVDDDWREWYEGAIDAGRAAGLAMWVTLWEGPIPGWFDDEGGFADDAAAGRWWPRWVETAAELVGDRIDGWFPMDDPVSRVAGLADDPLRHRRALTNTVVGWRDAWRILRGGPPVATSLGVRIVRPADQTVPAQQAARTEEHLRWRLWFDALRDGEITLPGLSSRAVQDLAGSLDLLGIALQRDVAPEAPGADLDDVMPAWEERVGTMVRRAAEDGPARPLGVSSLRLRWADDDGRRLLIEAVGSALRGAIEDGVDVDAAYYEPAIDPTTERADERDGLVDRNRDPKPSSAAWIGLANDRAG